MKKYNVVIHYAGAFTCQVEAENEEQAHEIAYEAFDEVPERDLIADLADVSVCDCWEADDE